MTSIATFPERPERSFLAWLLPGSVAMHVLVVMALPSASAVHHVQPPLVIEVADLPPPPPPPPEEPPKPTPEPPAPEPVAKAPPTTVAKANLAPSAPATTAAAKEEPAPNDAPADFTGTVMSNDGPGIAVRAGSGGSGNGTGTRPGPAATVARSGPVGPSGPRVVAVGDLSKPPRPPTGLDAALERNYPVEARRTGVAGRAVLRVKILPDGRIGSVQRMSETFNGFGEACERTVRSANWEPPIDREGSPVATEITYTCRFEVRS